MIFLQYFNVCVTSLSRYWLKSWQNYTFFCQFPKNYWLSFFFHRSPNSIQLYWTDVIQTEENKDYFKRSGPWFLSPNTIFSLKSTRTALDMFQQAPNRPISIEQIEMVLNKIVYRWSDICTIETFFFTCLINIKKFFFLFALPVENMMSLSLSWKCWLRGTKLISENVISNLFSFEKKNIFKIGPSFAQMSLWCSNIVLMRHLYGEKNQSINWMK